MFLLIDEFLMAAEVQSVCELADKMKFLEGRRSNPYNQTKNNLIADPADPLSQQASQIALAAFQRSETARNFVFPQRIALPQVCRYGVGMNYGAHVDSAFLPLGQQPMRSDVSCTIFLNDPASYEGGELKVSLGSPDLRLKGKPGQAVFYPSTTLHQVEPVISGERLVMITFIESQVADQMKRDLLHWLGEIRALEASKMDWRNRTRLEYVIANLHRMWAS